MNSLIDLFNSISSIPHKDQDKLKELHSLKEIGKSDFFLMSGKVPRTMGFVKSGLFRYFYCDNEGIEYTKGFFAENNILISYSALIENRASYFTIQALEDSVVEQINYMKFCELFSNSHWFKDITIALVQKAYCLKEERER